VSHYLGDRSSTSSSSPAAAASTASSPGKRTLTDQLTTPVQCKNGQGGEGAAQDIAASGLTGASQPLPHGDRIQALFGRHSIAGVEAHVGGPAAEASRGLGAQAYATGSSVAFAGAPDLHTAAHEAAHVVQQRAGVHLKGGMGQPGDAHERHADAVADMVVQGKSAEGLLDQYGGSGGGGQAVQCSFAGSVPIPGATSGFEIDMQTRNGAAATPATGASGMDGSIRFIPGRGAPNSNVIAIHQIVKLTDAGGADIDPATMPADRAARGAVGGPTGVRTADDAAAGVDGGFFTDVHHQPGNGSPAVPKGGPLLPRYDFQPAPGPGVPHVGSVQQPAQFGGGTGGVVGQTPGFKRSDDPADIRTAAMYDTPGTTSPTANLDFAFESVARGEDTNIDYGTVKWGFGLRAGRVVNEREPVVTAGSSATFGAAMERHRDFYVHEPVTFYFGFDSDALSGTEAAKIDAFLAYLTRNPDVQMSLQGFADQVGGASAYNVELSRRRANSVQAGLVGRGIAAARIGAPVIASGASTSATADAGTGDQGGDPAVGADQGREANRWANRRVVLTFTHPAPAPAPGPAAPPAGP
jgi:outer membrane protein OmpA-like peptidoglycan-associated protein